MKVTRFTFPLMNLVLVLWSSCGASGALLNGAFETGDLTGWHFDAQGGSYFIRPSPDTNPAAPFAYPFAATTTPAFNNVGVPGGTGNNGGPALQMYSHQSGSHPIPFVGPDGNQFTIQLQNYEMSVSQDVQLSQGTVVTGWGRFGSYDIPGFADFASVTVNGQAIWSFDLDQLGNPYLGQLALGPWQSWRFVAPSDGVYTLSLNILGDDQYDSWAYFANIQAVPEPAAVELVGISLGLLLVVRASRRKGAASPTGRPPGQRGRPLNQRTSVSALL